MTFSRPEALLFLAVPVVIVVFAWQYRGWGLAMPFDHRSHENRFWLRMTLRFFEILPAVMLAAVIGLLAGPQVLRKPLDERVLTNIQFCFDVSGSMSGEGRYEMARTAVENFVDVREGDAFGMTLFGTHTMRWLPLTRDLNAIRHSLDFADPRRQPVHIGGGTRIGNALEFCHDNMLAEAEPGDRMIVLVSDGVSSDLRDASSQAEMSDLLERSNITLFHVHVGTSAVPMVVADIAEQTGGEAFVATDRKGLDRVFNHIDRMRPAKFEPGGTVPMDFVLPFVLVAMSALGLHVMGLLGLRYTPW